jgi:hypothetical protein
MSTVSKITLDRLWSREKRKKTGQAAPPWRRTSSLSNQSWGSPPAPSFRVQTAFVLREVVSGQTEAFAPPG